LIIVSLLKPQNILKNNRGTPIDFYSNLMSLNRMRTRSFKKHYTLSRSSIFALMATPRRKIGKRA
jgi:hypothetical protein